MSKNIYDFVLLYSKGQNIERQLLAFKNISRFPKSNFFLAIARQSRKGFPKDQHISVWYGN